MATNDIKQKKKVTLANDTLIDKLFASYPKTLSDKDIDYIRNDLTFSQSDISRRVVTEKKVIQILSDNDEINANLMRYFSPDIVSQILETYLYGINVFEVNWKENSGLFYPILIQRDYRKFIFSDGVLKYNDGSLQEIPEYKVIYGLNRANFLEPYGESVLKKLFFPIRLKNAGLQFWAEFLERFGNPWAVAKTDMDGEEMAEQVYNMLSGSTATIGLDESIDIVQPSSNVDFEKLIGYCDNQINKVILGANLTANVKDGSYAAAQTHNEIREDMAANDEKILLFVLNRAVKFFKEVNNLDLEIIVKIYDTKPNIALATRDEKIANMGFKPTNDYIRETYNYEIDEKASKVLANKNHLMPLKKPFKEPKYLDKFDAAMPDLDEKLKGSDEELMNALNSILDKCESYEDAFNKFAELYDEKYPLPTLEKYMFNAIANSHIAGIIDED